MISAANSGHFRISEGAVTPLRNALVEMQSRLDRLSAETFFWITQAPKLGSHDYGQTVAQHDQKGGGGAAGSAAAVADQLRQVLEDADKALGQAVKNYQENEAATAQGLATREA
ncbi:hypothetical protein FCN18_02585 [Prauserella endophytica]|uniref:WXG100 family type VII secretion target n=1 Tax=Prauserella endophytica TaxID=1592324 RepID=A0ABY2SCY1_9PSEU|nr:hypothetical protein FCN18_02585 [Prauserella endophytica]